MNTLSLRAHQISPMTSLATWSSVQQVFLFHYNVLKQKPTKEELDIERYKITKKYSPLPPSNTAAINYQLHFLSQTTIYRPCPYMHV